MSYSYIMSYIHNIILYIELWVTSHRVHLVYVITHTYFYLSLSLSL